MLIDLEVARERQAQVRSNFPAIRGGFRGDASERDAIALRAYRRMPPLTLAVTARIRSVLLFLATAGVGDERSRGDRDRAVAGQSPAGELRR